MSTTATPPPDRDALFRQHERRFHALAGVW